MLLASNFERGVGGWRPVNLAGSVTATRVSDGTAQSGTAFLRVTTTAVGGSVAHDLSTLRRIPGTNDFASDSEISVLAWVRAAPGTSAMSGTLTVWQLGADPAVPANHPNSPFAVNSTWTLVPNSISLIAGSFDVRVEFYLGRTGTALDVDCVFVN
jgi:hypothetical protein